MSLAQIGVKLGKSVFTRVAISRLIGFQQPLKQNWLLAYGRVPHPSDNPVVPPIGGLPAFAFPQYSSAGQSKSIDNHDGTLYDFRDRDRHGDGPILISVLGRAHDDCRVRSPS